jgi:hypothetical protein
MQRISFVNVTPVIIPELYPVGAADALFDDGSVHLPTIEAMTTKNRVMITIS